jgi:peptidyl-prolyl cis-trans isomerase SurA
VREREVEPKVRVSDLEIDQFIQEQQGSNDMSSMELNLAQMLIATPEGATAAQKTALQARAQRALDRAKAGEDFGKRGARVVRCAGCCNGGRADGPAPGRPLPAAVRQRRPDGAGRWFEPGHPVRSAAFMC